MNDLSINKVEKYFFTFISYICHPVLIPTFGLYLVFQLFSKYFIFNPKYLTGVVTVYFIMSAVIPLIILTLFYYFKFIRSFYLKTREERLLVATTMTIFYFFTYYFTRQIYFHPNIFIYIISIPITSLIFSIIIAFKPTISMHTFVWGSLWGIILFYRFFVMLIPTPFMLVLLIFLSGLTITARLILSAHNYKEVLIGFFSGLVFGFGTISIVFLF